MLGYHNEVVLLGHKYNYPTSSEAQQLGGSFATDLGTKSSTIQDFCCVFIAYLQPDIGAKCSALYARVLHYL